MGTFRHTPDDLIIINETLIMPLAFFIIQEPLYDLGVGNVNQSYDQIGGGKRIIQTITSETITIGMWAEGDGYITNIATYSAAYDLYLNPIPSLVQAKITAKAGVDNYNASLKINNVVYDLPTKSLEYPIRIFDRIFNEFERYNRASALPANYYILDASEIQQAFSNLVNVEGLIDLMSEFFYQCNLIADIHKVAIDALGTVNDVQNYDYTTGFPPTAYNPDRTFFADFAINGNATWSLGVATATMQGNAIITSEKLNLSFSDLSYAAYAAADNADAQQEGTIRFDLTPKYSGSPATDQTFFAISKADTDNDNLITLTHNSAGNLILTIIDNIGTAIINNINLGAWSPTLDIEYHFELNYELSVGATRLFIDGTQFGATQTNIGTRDAIIAILYVGTDYTSTNISNFLIDNFDVLNATQHTINYTV